MVADHLNYLLAKLKCYGIDKSSLPSLLNHLTNQKQRTKIDSFFSSSCNTNTGVPQGSIFGYLLFYTFINDFFSITKSEVCKFADYNTVYSYGKNLNHVFSNLKYGLKNMLNWFKINTMKKNPGKFQFIVFRIDSSAPLNLNVTGNIILCFSVVKLLGITI